ncbi:unnamed protein product [Schistosoma bovis]|nr:unnamed protein product [Schistosoma bovis]CAH8503859.1 unnamed protein product [Schistosoma bovis]
MDNSQVNLIHYENDRNWILWRNSTLFLLILCTGIFISIDIYTISDRKYGIGESSVIIKRTIKNIIEKDKDSSTVDFMNDQSIHWNNNDDDDDKMNETFIRSHYSNPYRLKNYMNSITKTCLNMESIDWNMMLWRDKGNFYNEQHIRLVNINAKGAHLFSEDLNQLKNQMSYKKEVTQQFDNLSFLLAYPSGISVHINVKNIRLLPEYEDVEHLASDNGIVMDSSRKSNMQHWRKPLETIIKTACRYPLPKQYYLAMHPYLDRHTTARRHICQPNNVNSRLCPANYPSGYIFYDRSINGQCTQNLHNAILISDKASYLPPQLNSFYCTINSPLVNKLFQENIIESQSYLKDMHCDTQRRICQTCLKQSCFNSKTEMFSETNLKKVQNNLLSNHDEVETNHDLNEEIFYGNLLRVNTIEQNIRQANDPDCCGIKCYSNPSCLDYFGSRCEMYTSRHSNATEICLQGKTLKFTLNPEFDFTNGTYICHVRHRPPKILYTIETWLTLEIQGLPKLLWSSPRLKYNIQLMNNGKPSRRKSNKVNYYIQTLEQRFLKHGILLLWNENIYLEHKTSLPIWDDAIVHRSVDKEISLFQLKFLKDFGTEPPPLQRHKEEKYIVVQFSKPFQYSTSNWGNQTCQINISHIHRAQPIYAENTKVSIETTSIPQRTTSNAFLYTLKNSQKRTTIEIKSHINHSLLYTAACLNGLTFTQSIPNEFNDKINIPSDEKYSTEQIGRLYPEIQVSTQRVETNCDLNSTWRVTITGSTTTHKSTYIHLKLYTESLKSLSNLKKTNSLIPIDPQHILYEKDLILLNDPFDFITNYSNKKKEISFQIQLNIEYIQFPIVSTHLFQSVLLIIHIKDCFTDYLLSTLLNAQNNIPLSKSINANQNNTIMLKESLPNHIDSLSADKMHLPFVITCLIIGLSYIILLTIYTILKICQGSNKFHTNNIIPSSTSYSSNNEIQQKRYSSFSAYSTTLLNNYHRTSSQSQLARLTCPQKVCIMIYLCFRVFYTFLFTISVGLSFILSIETDATVEFTSAVHNNHFITMNSFNNYNGNIGSRLILPSMMNTMTLTTDIGSRWRGAKVWVLEAARMEDFSQTELLRQTQKGTSQISDCGKHYEDHSKHLSRYMMYISKKLISWFSQTSTKNEVFNHNDINENSMNYHSDNKILYEDSISQIEHEMYNINSNNKSTLQWTSNGVNIQIPTIEQETWNHLERTSWLPYLDTVDDYLRKTRDDLDTKVIDYWAPYDQLLANLLTNPWLAPAYRALNTSWLQERRISFMDRTYFGLVSSDFYSEDENQSSNDLTALNGARETQSLMLANFIGVPQPAHARLAGTRIWNSFRNLVPGLPSKFYYKLEPSSLSSSYSSSVLNKDVEFRRKPKLYHDHRQMLSSEDWYHIPSGQLDLDEKLNVDSFTDLNAQFYPFATTVTKRNGNPSTIDSNSYFLTLTQVRLLLLLLDAIIILSRCFQTFEFMHNIWFGDIKLINANHLIHDLNDNSQIMIDSFDHSMHHHSQQTQQIHSTYNSNYHYQPQLQIRSPRHIQLSIGSTPFLHPASCSSNLHESNHHSISNEFPTSIGTNHNEAVIANQPIRVSEYERKSSTGIKITQNNPPTLNFDNGTGRFTACYCCLDAHYLLVITGIGLLFIGLVLIWATDRHVRPGWLLAKTGVLARSRALEDCRQRTNAILKTIQPNHINMDLIRSAKINAAKEAYWINQLTNRLEHVQTQIQLQFITELCLLQKGLVNHYYVLDQHAVRIHVPEITDTNSTFSACELIGPNFQFTEQALLILSNWKLDPLTNKQIKHTLKTPVCHFSPVVPATYAESHLSRLLRMTSLNEQSHQMSTKKTNEQITSNNNQTESNSQVDGNQLDFNYEQLTTSIGSLSTLINAIYRLLLTSLTVMMAMGGLLVCLHMISILGRIIIRIPVRKIYYTTIYPPCTSVNNPSFSPTVCQSRSQHS